MREPLRSIDLELLTAIVPPHPMMASFMFVGAVDPSTTIEQQLDAVANADPDWVRAGIEIVWAMEPMPPAADAVVAAGPAGARRIAEALSAYWQAVMAPHWSRMRSVLDADITHRVSRLTTGGLNALLADLHPELQISGPTISIDKPRLSRQHDLAGRGLLLVPSVFAWPNLVVGVDPPNPPSVTYGARGVGVLWEHDVELDEDDALGALLGRTRAMILARLDLPLSTTRLATKIGYSPPSVSQHLSVLRRCGLVTSRRAGRSVLHQRTALATSLLAASPARRVAPVRIGAERASHARTKSSARRTYAIPRRSGEDGLDRIYLTRWPS
ncbi:MAG: DUF5937 family protein [Jiangellaceae bacterium]